MRVVRDDETVLRTKLLGVEYGAAREILEQQAGLGIRVGPEFRRRLQLFGERGTS